MTSSLTPEEQHRLKLEVDLFATRHILALVFQRLLHRADPQNAAVREELPHLLQEGLQELPAFELPDRPGMDRAAAIEAIRGELSDSFQELVLPILGPPAPAPS